MDDNDTSKIYGLASRLNGGEYLLMNIIGTKPGVIAYHTFEEAKSVFDGVYQTYFELVGKDIQAWGQFMMAAVAFYPVIIGFPSGKAVKLIQKWRESNMTFSSNAQFLNVPCLYTPMKPGFIKQFQVLDIVRDLEHTVTIGPDGKPLLQEFEIRYGPNADAKQEKPLTKEDLNELFRRRGFQ